MKDLGAARRHPRLRQLPDALRLPRDDGRAEGQRHRVPAAARTTPGVLWDYWERHLDPDLLHRPHAEGPGRGQGGADHRRLLGHRPGGGAQDRRGRRHHGHLRARPGEARQAKKEIAEALGKTDGHTAGHLLGRPRQQRGRRLRPHGAVARRDLRRRRRPGQQRRPLDPPRHRDRATTASTTSSACMQLNYFGALRMTMGLLPQMVREAARPGDQHLVDRRADQRAALLGLRRVQGGARRLDRVRVVRVRRRRRQVHDDQHAAGAHADDRAHQALPERADAVARGGGRPDRATRSSTSRCASPRGSASSARCCTRWRRGSRRS